MHLPAVVTWIRGVLHVFVRVDGLNTEYRTQIYPLFTLILTTTVFRPESGDELQDAVKECIHAGNPNPES